MQSPDQHLSALADALGRPNDLSTGLGLLLTLAVAAIPECIGVSLLISGSTPDITVSAFAPAQPRGPIRASLAVSLPRPPGSSRPRALLILYAVRPAVFSLVAPELLALLGLGARHITVDGHLAAPDPAAQRAALTQRLQERGAVDRALGVLLDRGMVREEGLAELRRLADVGGIGIVSAARALLGGLGPA